jgi:hypothetical protein
MAPGGALRGWNRRWASLVAVGAVGTHLMLVDPAAASWYPGCVVHAATGFECPGCGATRAAHELLRGNVGAALSFNALIVVALPFIVWRYIAWLGQRPPWPVLTRWPLVASVAVLTLSFAVVRNLDIEPWVRLAASG